MAVLDNLNNNNYNYSQRDGLGTFTADGTYALDFSGYKYIEVSLSASNVYGNRKILDAELIRSNMADGWNTLHAGSNTGNYNATTNFLLSSTGIQIKYLSSPQANVSVSVVGIK